MMRGVGVWSLAVRRPDGTIGVRDFPLVSWMKRWPILGIPLVRGVVALVESLIIGMRALSLSANESLGEEEEELSKKEIGLTLAVALVIALVLFFLLPLGLTGLFRSWLGTGFLFWAVEGVMRVAIFIGYIVAVTQIGDLRRVFEYHGAEHMSIHALEHGDELTVANAKKYSRLHLRCGTSFLLIVMVISIFVFALVRWPAWYLLIASRVVLVPLIAGISYEITKVAGRHEDNLIVRITMAPGLGLQRLTAKRPNDEQLEVGLAALKRVIEIEPQDRPPVAGVEIMA